MLTLVCVISFAGGSAAQDGPLKAETVPDAPPSELAAPVRAALDSKAIRIVDGQGKPFALVWLCKEVPASSRPAGPQGAVLFPFLKEGELIGAIRLLSEGHDYRDQAIPPGVYTLRYGLQPVNGDHLGVSTYRDYALLLPAKKDAAGGPIGRQGLEKASAEAAGSNHPAVLLLLAAPAGTKAAPATIQDAEKNLWGVILPLSLGVKGQQGVMEYPIQLIVVGAAMV
jgi:hypothetical protein